MRPVTLHLNGETVSAAVEDRTQLAELIRDHFDYTGTHLGCEQGVCGACTVLVDGMPVRSCITYARTCDGSTVTTVEGLREDELASALRAAFSEHHALQCGFCTPGMLITARDVIQRLGRLDEAQIRQELSGNLCRCTGYMGIVDAVRSVSEAHGQPGSDAPTKIHQPAHPGAQAPAPFQPFRLREPDDGPSVAGTATTNPGSGRLAPDDGQWTLLHRELEVKRSPDEVWSLLENLPDAASCLPGVSVSEHGEGRFKGTASVRFGPVRASFAGEGTYEYEPRQREGSIEAQGAANGGQTRLEVQFRYAVNPASPEPTTPMVGRPAGAAVLSLSIRYHLQGALAQFNRPELTSAFADVMLSEFARNCERRLGDDGAAQGPAPIQAGGLGLILRTLWHRWFGKT